MEPRPLSLRERKQLRTRDTIIKVALELFVEHGFDGVTVNQIAERAEVGRTTFFRYFADKQELLFADDDELMQALIDTVDPMAQQHAPIGDSLETAIAVTRRGLLAMCDVITGRAAWLPTRQQLIMANAALTARSLVKERQFFDTAIDLLVKHGADRVAATLATGIAAACYQAGQAQIAQRQGSLTAAVEAAYERYTGLDRRLLRRALSQ